MKGLTGVSVSGAKTLSWPGWQVMLRVLSSWRGSPSRWATPGAVRSMVSEWARKVCTSILCSMLPMSISKPTRAVEGALPAWTMVTSRRPSSMVAEGAM